MSATITALVMAFASSAAFADATPKDKLAPLQGGWKFESLEVNGKAAELGDTRYWWFIKGDKVLYGGNELATLTVDTGTAPKCIDLAFREPKRTYEGIYAIDGDTLKICVNQTTEGAKERPTDFATKDKSAFRLLVFKRDSDRKADSIEDLAGFVGIMIMVDETSKQVLVSGVIGGSPAEKAGLKKDDIVLKVVDQDAPDLQSVVKIIRKVNPGSEVALRVKRDGKEKDIVVKAVVLPFYLLDS